MKFIKKLWTDELLELEIKIQNNERHAERLFKEFNQLYSKNFKKLNFIERWRIRLRI